MPFTDTARDRVYTECARAISQAGEEREALFLARLALLLCERLGDEAVCLEAIADALHELPQPSLSAGGALDAPAAPATAAAD
jgi:hypothetical protein